MTQRRINWLMLLVHLGAWVPLLNIGRAYWAGEMAINPIQDLTFGTGFPTLILLILTLAVTPLVTLTGWRQVIPLRRWLGLYAFMYATIHFLIFVGLDYGFDLGLIGQAIIEKRYVLAGLGAFVIMIPLALTSTTGWQKRLGKDWKLLHRAIYPAGLLAVLHFIWLVKSDIREPLTYGAIVVFLLLMRISAIRRNVSGWRQISRRVIQRKRPRPEPARAVTPATREQPEQT